MPNIVVLIFCLVLCQAAGIIGSVFTIPSIKGWYKTLRKPKFSPPNWVFGPAWTLLYLLMGISLAFVWGNQTAMLVFGIQLILNVLWSYLFFGLKSPLYGLTGIVFLWLAIVGTIFVFWSISTIAAVILLPYLAWVSFASFLNYAVYKLN